MTEQRTTKQDWDNVRLACENEASNSSNICLISFNKILEEWLYLHQKINSILEQPCAQPEEGPTIAELRQYVFATHGPHAGWQKAFAKECGVSPSMVSAIFSETRKMTHVMAAKIGWEKKWVKK